MTLDPTKWREIPGRPGYYERVGEVREPDMVEVRRMIRDAVTKARAVSRGAVDKDRRP